MEALAAFENCWHSAKVWIRIRIRRATILICIVCRCASMPRATSFTSTAHQRGANPALSRHCQPTAFQIQVQILLTCVPKGGLSGSFLVEWRPLFSSLPPPPPPPACIATVMSSVIDLKAIKSGRFTFIVMT
jgi:hypothetical protein